MHGFIFLGPTLILSYSRGVQNSVQIRVSETHMGLLLQLLKLWAFFGVFFSKMCIFRAKSRRLGLSLSGTLYMKTMKVHFISYMKVLIFLSILLATFVSTHC